VAEVVAPVPVAVQRVKVGPLTRTFDLLHRVERERAGQLTILHLGDSHIASDIMSGELRRLMQRRWGNAGRGYTQPGRPWKSWRQDGTHGSMGDGWTVQHGMRRSSQGPWGLSGIRLEADSAGAWIERTDETPFDQAVIHVLRAPGQGSLHVYAGGKQVATLPTALEEGGEETQQAAALSVVLPWPARVLRVEVVGDGPVDVLGVRTLRAGHGVRYESVGLNGARTYTFLGFDEALMRAEVEAIAPDLVVVGFGTNEAYNLREKALTPAVRADLVRGFVGILERLRKGAPQADCLVLLPMDLIEEPRDESCYMRERVKRGKRKQWVKRLRPDIDPLVEPQCAWAPLESVSFVSEASREAAEHVGCAVWDQRRAQGGPGAHDTWRRQSPALGGRDGVHLTSAGYQALATGLFDDLSDAYTRHTQGQDATLHTTAILPTRLPALQPPKKNEAVAAGGSDGPYDPDAEPL
jgi:lysophospholipase L1-like esterase